MPKELDDLRSVKDYKNWVENLPVPKGTVLHLGSGEVMMHDGPEVCWKITMVANAAGKDWTQAWILGMNENSSEFKRLVKMLLSGFLNSMKDKEIQWRKENRKSKSTV